MSLMVEVQNASACHIAALCNMQTQAKFMAIATCSQLAIVYIICCEAKLAWSFVQVEG